MQTEAVQLSVIIQAGMFVHGRNSFIPKQVQYAVEDNMLCVKSREGHSRLSVSM